MEKMHCGSLSRYVKFLLQGFHFNSCPLKQMHKKRFGIISQMIKQKRRRTNKFEFVIVENLGFISTFQKNCCLVYDLTKHNRESSTFACVRNAKMSTKDDCCNGKEQLQYENQSRVENERTSWLGACLQTMQQCAVLST